VLQFSGTYEPAPGQRRWQRGDMRLIHDDVDNADRYTFGDLLYPLIGFQTSQPLGGISFARDYTIQPYTTIQPSGQQQFILTSPSKVEVDVNGRPTQVIRLPPGRYDIRNFPFAQGANDVQLHVTDAAGRTTTTEIPFFFDSTLLDRGISQFNYAIGLPMVSEDGLRKYPLTTPALTMFHRVGVSDSLTLGGNYQGNDKQQMAGLEVGTATAVGNLHFDLAGSHFRGFGADYAGQAQYSFANVSANGSGRNLIASATYTGPRFATLGTTLPQNGTKLDLSVRYSQPIAYQVYGGLGGSYDFNRNGPNTYNVDVSVRRTITANLNANLDLIRSYDVGGKIDNRLLISVTLAFDGGRQFARGGFDSDLRATTADWEYIPTNDLYQPYGDLHVGNDSQANTVNGDVTYNTTRLETTLSHSETLPVSSVSGSTTDRRSTLAFGTALVFADGYVSPSRPVGDSFALIATQKNAAGYDFKVDPQGDYYTTRNDFGLPAVIPNLNGYQLRTTQVAIPDLPNGFDVGPETFVIEPTYRSGSLVTLGTDATVFLDGTLIGENGEPLALISGTIKDLADPKAPPITFFTNRNGRFRVEGMKPGDFELDFAGAFPGVTSKISIPAKASGIYRIGTIKLPVDPGQ